MTKLKFYSKSQEFDAFTNKPNATRVVLTNDEGAIYPVLLDAAVIEQEPAELEMLALSKIYEDNFPNKANNDKFDALGDALKKVDGKIAEMNEKLEEVEQVNQHAMTMASENRLQFGKLEKGLNDKIKKAVEDALKAKEEN